MSETAADAQQRTPASGLCIPRIGQNPVRSGQIPPKSAPNKQPIPALAEAERQFTRTEIASTSPLPPSFRRDPKGDCHAGTLIIY